MYARDIFVVAPEITLIYLEFKFLVVRIFVVGSVILRNICTWQLFRSDNIFSLSCWLIVVFHC